MGAGVQGLAEAPWLDLDTPAATNGWWARSAAATSMTEQGTGAFNAVPTGNGQFGTGQFGAGQFGTGQFHGGGHEDSHTLVVDRGDGGRYHGGREPFLGRWLFSPRLLIVVVVIGLGVGIGLGGWWLTSGRFAQVPSVSEDSVTQATTVLTADGFTVKQSRVHSNTVRSGSVVATRPAGRVAKGSTITILVSSGPFTSVVPKVRGETLAVAQAALQRVHLVPTTERVGANAPVGTVIGTNPPAGKTWPQTKTVTILVSSGPPLPNFFGMNIQAAQQWAGQHDVNLQQQADNNSQQPQGTITSQRPAAGATFQPGQTVVVNVSTGPQVVNVPNPIGDVGGTGHPVAAGRRIPGPGRTGTARLTRCSTSARSAPAPRGSTIVLDVGY